MASKAALLTRPDLVRRRAEAVGVAGGEDDVGALGPGAAGRLEPDAGAAADHDDGLAGQRSSAALMTPPLVIAGLAAISPRSAFSAAT